MSHPDDYHDEMGRLGRLSDRDVERLLGGHAPAADDGLDDLAAHLRALKAALLQAPAEAVIARHVAAATEASRSSSRRPAAVAPARPAAGRRARSLVPRVAAALLLAPVGLVGLAYAGVDLPGVAAERAIEAVLGVELPHQARPAPPNPSSSERDNDVSDFATGATERGCAFGQAVADLADDRSEEVRRDDPDKKDPCERAEGAGGGRATGTERSAPGRAKAEHASESGRAKAEEAPETGTERRRDGRSTARSRTDDVPAQPGGSGGGDPGGASSGSMKLPVPDAGGGVRRR